MALTSTSLVVCNFQSDMCLTKLDTEFLIVCSCSREVHCKINLGTCESFHAFFKEMLDARPTA